MNEFKMKNKKKTYLFEETNIIVSNTSCRLIRGGFKNLLTLQRHRRPLESANKYVYKTFFSKRKKK